MAEMESPSMPPREAAFPGSERRGRMKMNISPQGLLKTRCHLKSQPPRSSRERPTGVAPGPQMLMGAFIRNLQTTVPE